MTAIHASGTAEGSLAVSEKAKPRKVLGRLAAEEMRNPRRDVPVMLVRSGGIAAVLYALVIGGIILAIFPALTILRRRYPDATRPYRVPGGTVGAWAVVIITGLFVIVTAITLLWPGAINAVSGQSYSIEPAYSVSRPFSEWVTLGAMAAMIALGLVFWLIGERNRRAGLAGITI